MHAMTNAERFERAFSPDESRQVDAMISLVNVIRMNLAAQSADVKLDDKVFSVSPVRCEICETWEPDCGHIATVRAIVADEVAARAEDQDDLAATYEAALSVGVQ